MGGSVDLSPEGRTDDTYGHRCVPKNKDGVVN